MSHTIHIAQKTQIKATLYHEVLNFNYEKILGIYAHSVQLNITLFLDFKVFASGESWCDSFVEILFSNKTEVFFLRIDCFGFSLN